MTITAEHLQIAGVVIVVLIAVAFIWWLVHAAIRIVRGRRTAYWLREADIDDDDDGDHDGPR